MDFYSRISDYYNDIFPLNYIQVTFVLSYLDKSAKNQNLMDIGCGTGLLSTALSDNFDSISAIDTNEKMLEIARQSAGAKSINFIRMSMLDIDIRFPEMSFDNAICFGNTIVHLQNIEEIERFFKKVKFVLKPEGRFLCQLINYNFVLDSNLKGLPTIDNEKIKFERYYNVDENGMIDFSTTLTIKETGEKLNNCVKLFPARRNQITNILHSAGFKHVKSYSSFAKHEYNPNSLPLVFECQ
jgi:glycine/sarcosine N-methyltransferase